MSLLRLALSESDSTPKSGDLPLAQQDPLLWVNPLTGRLLVDANIESISLTPPTGAASTQVQGTADTNAAKVGYPVLGAGLYQNPSSYSPAGTAGNVSPFALDWATGGILTIDRSKNPINDALEANDPEPTKASSVVVKSTSTAYVAAHAIDLAGYRYISILPEVTGATAGSTATMRLEWSMDGTNWFTDTSDTLAGTAGSPPRAFDNDQIQVAFSGASVAFIPGSPRVAMRRARYVRITQASDGVKDITTKYHFQLH